MCWRSQGGAMASCCSILLSNARSVWASHRVIIPTSIRSHGSDATRNRSMPPIIPQPATGGKQTCFASTPPSRFIGSSRSRHSDDARRLSDAGDRPCVRLDGGWGFGNGDILHFESGVSVPRFPFPAKSTTETVRRRGGKGRTDAGPFLSPPLSWAGGDGCWTITDNLVRLHRCPQDRIPIWKPARSGNKSREFAPAPVRECAIMECHGFRVSGFAFRVGFEVRGSGLVS